MTRTELLKAGLEALRAYANGLDMDASDELYQLTETIAYVIAGSSRYGLARIRGNDPSLSADQRLTQLLSLYGQHRASATSATDGLLRVDVTGSGSWLGTQNFVAPNGLIYSVNSAGSWTASDTHVFVFVTCDSTGSNTNQPIGTVFTAVSAPAGFGSGVLVFPFVGPGIDEESNSSVRERLTESLAGRRDRMGSDDVERAILMTPRPSGSTYAPGIGQAYVYAGLRHKFALDGLITSPAQWSYWDTTTRSWIASHRYAGLYLSDIESHVDGSVSAGYDFEAWAATSQDTDIDVTIYTQAGYGRSWGYDQDASLTIAAVPNVSQILVSDDPNDPSAGCGVGSMIAVNSVLPSESSYYSYEVRRVIAVTPSGTQWLLSLDTELPSTTVSGDVYPAGTTTLGIYQAIRSFCDQLGPADYSTTITRYPAVSAVHPCDLDLSRLSREIANVQHSGKRRVNDIDFTAPAADLVCTAPLVVSNTTVTIYVIRPTTYRIRHANR
jgi:hypothetical protein